MSVDFDAIAQRGRCDVSSLRLAVPLLEQGYLPPFLARYRRDELGGVNESSLWELLSALQAEQQVQKRREGLIESWEKTTLRDPALGNSLKSSRSLRVLNRLGRRLKRESGDGVSSSIRLASRVLNPLPNDSGDATVLVSQLDGVENADDALAGLDAALAERLAGDPRIISAAVRWLSRHAKIHISQVHDPHSNAEEESSGTKKKKGKNAATKSVSVAETDASVVTDAKASITESTDDVSPSGNDVTDSIEAPADAHSDFSTESTANPTESDAQIDDVSSDKTAGETEKLEDALSESNEVQDSSLTNHQVEDQAIPTPASDGTDVEASAVAPQEVAPEKVAPESEASSKTASDSAIVTDADSVDSLKQAVAKDFDSQEPSGAQATKSASPSSKKQKKVSPRQRRRRWLVSVLKTLAGKRFAGDKLSAFQIVMLGRALRSQVVVCSFEYDATRLVAELQRVAGSINRQVEAKLQQIILEHEGVIREAGEAAWWDDLHEKASAKLVSVTSDHLSRQVNRGALDGRVVLAIDAVGPRTAATSIVCADGRILHNEDLPCQLSTALRTQAVNRLGELIHSYHVDLIVVSNGPSRRATMVALGDLIQQSPEDSIHWTLADRNGADVYAGSSIADDEMRTTPRRFRAAAWLAFSVLQPAQAFAKVDPLKLRLSSFQRELADDQLATTLDHVIVSGASRGGVDVNAAPVSWLTRIPGVSSEVAEAINQARREKLFDSRESLGQLSQWGSVAGSRQALPFLRVFGSEQTLDGTLIHPDDYPLAEKLAGALDVELPPANPPGYVAPDFTTAEDPTTKSQISEAPSEEEPAAVEEFSNAAEEASDFSIDESVDGATQVAQESDLSTSDAGSQSASEVSAESSATETSATETSAIEEQDGSPGSPGSPEATPDDTQTTVETSSEDGASGESSDTPSVESSEEAKQDDGTATQDESPVISGPALDKESIPEPVRRDQPEAAKIDKCVKEWQVGSRRSHQLVQWLCDPFGDSDSSGNPPAVLSRIPSTKALKQGDKVIGVIVGVMPFGVFVELAPDCSGLVHVSRVSDSYVEDLHEAVQVGDVITAWVTGIDEKRRRVALSAISPEREAELEAARQANRGNSARGNRGSSDGNRRGRGGQGNRGGSQRSAGGSQNRADGQRGGKPGGTSRRGDSRGGSQRRDGGGRGRSGRSGGGSRGRDRKPESYGVVSKAESKPISDAMQKGDEPLRSFGDLMQFFGTSNAPKSVDPKAAVAASEPKQSDPLESSSPPDATTPDATTPDATTPDANTPESSLSQQVEPAAEKPRAGSENATGGASSEETPSPKEDA